MFLSYVFISFHSDGRWVEHIGECVIFPSKYQRDWSKFQRPFKNGDIVCNIENAIIIYMKISTKGYCGSFASLDRNNTFTPHYLSYLEDTCRFATEKEKQKLFDSIKANGYYWNAETKTLEKQTKPIFNIGDKIEKLGYRFTIAQVKDDYYLTKCGNKIPFDNQDDFRLVPNKFDITTLKPFDKVLVRNTNTECWRISLFGCFSNEERYFMCLANCAFYQCIPYDDDTQHLLGRVIDAPKFYKTW